MPMGTQRSNDVKALTSHVRGSNEDDTKLPGPAPGLRTQMSIDTPIQMANHGANPSQNYHTTVPNNSQSTTRNPDTHFNESVKRLRSWVESRSPRKKHHTAPIPRSDTSKLGGMYNIGNTEIFPTKTAKPLRPPLKLPRGVSPSLITKPSYSTTSSKTFHKLLSPPASNKKVESRVNVDEPNDSNHSNLSRSYKVMKHPQGFSQTSPISQFSRIPSNNTGSINFSNTTRPTHSGKPAVPSNLPSTVPNQTDNVVNKTRTLQGRTLPQTPGHSKLSKTHLGVRPTQPDLTKPTFESHLMGKKATNLPHRSVFSSTNSDNPRPPALKTPQTPSSDDTPTSKNLVERMIAYSRAIGNSIKSPASNTRTDTNKALHAQRPASSLQPPLPRKGVDELAPSPVLNNEMDNGCRPRTNISMHTDISSNNRPAPNEISPKSSHNFLHQPKAFKSHFSGNNDIPSIENTVAYSSHDTSPRVTLEHFKEGDSSNSNQPNNANGNQIPRSTLSTHPRRVAIPSSGIRHLASAYTPKTLSQRSTPLSHSKPKTPVFKTGTNLQPNFDNSREGKTNMDSKTTEVSNSKLSAKPWNELQWRQFSVAMRDSIAQQNLSLNSAISLLSDMKSRLPSDMQHLSLNEIVRRLIVWVNSTENMKKH